MSLTPEWRGRIEQWQHAISEMFFTRLGDVALSGFITREQLSPGEALRRRFRPIPAGTRWGAEWEYAWLRGTIRLPRQAAGRHIVLQTHKEFGEGRVIINGREIGGRDWAHQQLLLAIKGRPGARYDVLMEIYAGHGPTPCGGGPALDGVPTVRQCPPVQRTLYPVCYGIWNEDAYQAWLDMQTLLELRDILDPNSLRVSEIDAALKDFTIAVDVELPLEQALETVRAGRRRLARALDCRNGSSAPLLHCFGHSHIDVAWLWPLRQTERKCAQTFGTQLSLMEQYPEYKFLQSQPHLYNMTKRLYPDLYARIKAAVRRGQWLPEGGMWVEADTNITGGESLIRQFIHGKRFFKNEFGVNCRLMWLPDVFGYSGAMPQIMAGCGIKWFSTQKIFWTYNGGDPFPYNSFWWEGIDGTRVFAHIHNDYNSQTNPKSLHQRWAERVQKDLLRSRIVPFGHGDGGGGPTRDHLEYLRRQRDLEGLPRTVIVSPLKYFREEEIRPVKWPVYVGELYYMAHRGTYTTQARIKRGNRFSEMTLREAEMWSSAAIALAGFRYPYEIMDKTWKDVLLNQFHDIIPGSSIHRVYEEAEALYAEILTTARKTAENAAAKLLSRRDKSVTVFNSLSWCRRQLVPLPPAFKGATADGIPVPTQKMAGKLFAEVVVPPCGWISLTSAKHLRTPNTLKATPTLLENDLIRVRLNAKAEITSLLDKQSGVEFAAGTMNSLKLYKDVPRAWEAWDIDSTYKLTPAILDAPVAVRVTTAGPLAAMLEVRRRIGKSTLTQEIILRRGNRRVDFRTVVNWREKHRMLKVSFPTRIHANEALHEIQFGHIARPNHASRPFDADRFEVCNHKWSAVVESNRGVAVLNDCKYGLNVEGGVINLTLLRSPQAPDMEADQGLQIFTYSLYAWAGSFFESDVAREAYDLNTPVFAAAGAADTASLIQVSAPNVILETMKPAEDRSGDIILRLYECKRSETRCRIAVNLPFKTAWVTNMLEDREQKLPVRGGTIQLAFRPFEIKTLRLR